MEAAGMSGLPLAYREAQQMQKEPDHEAEQGQC